MAASALGFSFKASVSSGEYEINRMTKEGGWEKVTMKATEYEQVGAGEKLVWISGLTKPYVYLDKKKVDPETGKPEEVPMIRLEFTVIDGRLRGAKYSLSFSLKVTKGTNLGKIINAILRDQFDPAGDWTPEEIVRRPFYMNTEVEQNGQYTNLKFVSARFHDEAMDGPVPGVTTIRPAGPATSPEPAKPNADTVWNDL